MAKIYIDPGHGGHDGGASGSGLREKDWVLEVSLELARILKQAGHSVKLSRTTDNFIGLTARTNDANRWRADIFISIHFNAGGGFGWEDFIFNGNVSNNTRKLQNDIHSAIKPILSKHGMRNRGKKSANFAVLRQTSMPAVLIEGGFVDTTDNVILRKTSYKQDVAIGLANGIQNYFGLNKVVPQSIKAGWKKNGTGWWYVNRDGTYPKNQWKKVSGTWYHFNSRGYMQTGWLKDDGRWYWLDKSGAMVTGFVQVAGKTYFMNLAGRMTEDEDLTFTAAKSGELTLKK